MSEAIPPTVKGARCVCDRGPVIAAAFHRNSSLLVRRIADMGHHTAADWRCADCIADLAEAVANNAMRAQHPDFAEPTAPVALTSEGA